MKNLTNIFIILSLVVIGFIIRILFLDKPDGLWNDEYIGWWIASTDFGKELFKKIFSNCHMPLYYFYLKGWMNLFGDSDLSLRLSSVIIGTSCIISSFFLGKTYKNISCGLICATFTTLSSFAIYFSQEVRPYSLIFLISTILAIFFTKTLRNPNKINFSLYILFNFLLLITHTISFVYVFFNLLIFSILLLKNNPEYRTKIYSTYVILTILFLPLLPFLFDVLTRETLSQNWGEFTISKIIFCLIDYFTPILTNITNSPLNLITFFKTNNIFNSLIFILIPSIISIYFLIKGLKNKSKELIALTICTILYFIVLIVASIMGKLILSTKYSIEIFPTLILLFSVGATTSTSKFNKFLAIIYFTICLIFLTTTQAPQFQTRAEGHKTPAKLLVQANLSKDDYIISLYHQLFRYEKYLPLVPQNVINIDKNTIGQYLVDKNYNSASLAIDGKEKLKNAFLGKEEQNITQNFNTIFKSIPSRQKIHIIVPAQVAFFSSNDLKRIANDKKEYDRTQIIFLAFSYAKIKLINSASNYCNFISIQEKAPWYVITFIKK